MSDPLKNIAKSDGMLKKPLLPSILVLSILVLGTIGYYLLWQGTEASLLDALYMTVITMTTVGYSEVYPLNDFGRLFTIFISVFGIGSLFYVLSVLMENLVIIQLQNVRGKKNKLKKIQAMQDHIIVVGFGKVGKLSIEELSKSNKQFIIIDDEIEEDEVDSLMNGHMFLKGDATEDDVLLKAGIEKARGIIVTTGSSATNVFVVLSAKVLNPDIFIVARSDDESAVEKLQKAGADRVVNPYSIGGQRLANLMINPNVIDFLDTNFGVGKNNLKIENLKLPENCIWYGKTLKELDIRKNTGASILTVLREGNPVMNPGGDFLIEDGDQLVVVGTREQLKNLENLTLQ